MKTRHGFVSNSSSSSFVVVGFKANPAEQEQYDYDDGLWLEGENCMVIGEVIAQGSDYDFDDTETEIGDIVQMHHRVAKEHGVDLGRIKLYTGVRHC